LGIDIRDRIICTAFSSVSTEKEIRSALALSSEQGCKATVIDLAGYEQLKEDVANHKNVSLAINFPYQGVTNKLAIAGIVEADKISASKEFYVGLNRFDVSKCNLSKIRDFIKEASLSTNKPINFAVEASWTNSTECLDKICSVLEPYERHALAISTYCKKPDKLKEILEIGKHLLSNGSCRYSYFGALPGKQEGILEILSSGFVYCAIPKQFLSLVI